MKSITLRYLNLEDKPEFLRAMNENWESNFDFLHYFDSLAENSFEKYVSLAPDFGKGLHIPKEHVPSSMLFAFNEEGNLVGRTSIRHELNDGLLKVGGHIGYGVCPSFRRMGYATMILEESLKWVKENLPGIVKVLVTCDEGNMGSQKTIEKNGEVLENIVEVGSGPRKMRFWITL